MIIRNLRSFEKKSVKKRKAANRKNVELIFWLNRLIANQKREKIRFTDHKNVHLDMNFVFEKGPVCGVTFPSTGISGRNIILAMRKMVLLLFARSMMCGPEQLKRGISFGWEGV